MKILHTSDWHIGRRFKGVDMQKWQQHALDWLISYIEQEHIQLLMEYKKANFYVKGIMKSEVGLEEGIEHSGNKEKSSFEILVLKEDNL